MSYRGVVCRTYQLLLDGHGSPTTLTLFLNSTLGNTFAKISGDDGTSRLHVQEVGSQGSLGRIGVMLALLALLLLLNCRNGDGHGDWARLNVEDAKVLVLLRQTSQAIVKGRLAQKEVCLREILSGKGANNALNSSQTLVDLFLMSVCDKQAVSS